jgi:hypothetical protein
VGGGRERGRCEREGEGGSGGREGAGLERGEREREERERRERVCLGRVARPVSSLVPYLIFPCPSRSALSPGFIFFVFYGLGFKLGFRVELLVSV